MPNLIIGSPPRGEDYFGQEALIENLWTKLKHDNVLLVAPRRFGKTGAMYKLLDGPRFSYRPLYMDVEHIETAADFLVELIAHLIRDQHFSQVIDKVWQGAKGFGQFLKNLPASIELGGVKVELRDNTDISKNWQSYGERVMSLVAKEGPPLLLLIDEFAIMINNIAMEHEAEAQQLLRWFRGVRIAPDTQTRFVIGGSINLVSTLDAHGWADTVNDLAIVRLKPFDSTTAKNFIEAILTSRNIKPTPEIVGTLLELVGAPIPYLLAVLLTSILERARATNSELSKEMIMQSFEEDLLGGDASAFFTQYRSRLDRYYPGSEARAAKAILATLSKAQGAIDQDQLYHVYLTTPSLATDSETNEHFLQLMHKLENDFYVVGNSGSYEFFSRVIKLWWKSHYGFQGR